MSPLVRPATTSDVPLLAAIAEAAYAPYVELMGRRPAPMDTDYDEAIERHVVHVAEVEGSVVGFLVLVDEADATLLENVAVRPSHTGRGIGGALIRLAEEHAAARTGVVRLYTNAAMEENLRLYARLGYDEVDRREEDGFDRVFFEKRLS